MTGTDMTGWTIVFDLDGTLIDTAPDLHASLNHSLESAGLTPVPFVAIRGMIGEGAKAMIRKGIAWNGDDEANHDIEPLWEAFLAHYRENICRLSRPFPDAVASIDRLLETGAVCAVCTNKTQKLAEAVLDTLNLSGRFSAIVGADAVPEKKPNGDHIIRTIKAAGGMERRAIMVGDSQTDERAARDAGLPFVFVTFGYGPEPEGFPEMVTTNTYKEVMAAITTIMS
ncbi:MAG: HAD-IA family hydrolase [Henriciella sp.]|uniref:HAD-IA family hydrolase n=1 Tax=Henriciella sp. TaxID=1968823 RepID=UPI0032EE912D